MLTPARPLLPLRHSHPSSFLHFPSSSPNPPNINNKKNLLLPFKLRATPEFESQFNFLWDATHLIKHYRNKKIVIKYGGAAMTFPSPRSSFISNIVTLFSVGIHPILVHGGGGPKIDTWLTRLDITPQFHQGLRIIDVSTMEIVEMVLVGNVNFLASLINIAGDTAGATAVGLSGKDARLLTARPSPDSARLGLVGDVASVDPSILHSTIASGRIPIIASVAADETGQAYSVNADTAAGEIAAAVGAEKLILLTDVAGILKDKENPKSLVNNMDIATARRMMDEGEITGGMIPKVKCCMNSLAHGVKKTSIIDGRIPHSLLLDIITPEGVGTMITL